jgi:hypothetical protein
MQVDASWEIVVNGGTTDAVERAVMLAVNLLRSEAKVEGLSPDEQDYWREDVVGVSMSSTVSSRGRIRILLDVDCGGLTSDARWRVAAVLLGGVEAAAGDLVMQVEGVTEFTVHTAPF